MSKVKKPNDVTLFSNGIGHFRRIYDIPAKISQKISIPFKRDHIGDVAASIQVFGKVRLDSPPSFTPMNSEATALKINQNEAMTSILTKLSGAEISLLSKPEGESKVAGKKYTLLGIESRDSTKTILERGQADRNESKKDQFMVLMNEEGQIVAKNFREIFGFEFTDEAVRAEIKKSLKANYQQIKPDSTFLDFVLSSLDPEGGAEAQVQYTIPVAAWKIRYAIRQSGDKFTLEGAAVIDNNTDEDWDNFQVSVVTGNPISFATDIANIVTPTRKTVRLVDGVVLDNVSVEEIPQGFAASANENSRRYLKSSISNRANFGLENLSESQYEGTVGPAAMSAGVDSKDVGDFCVFTAKEPITILSRKSAVVPMFSVPLTSAGMVLLYQAEKHERRPYRTVKFKNETLYSLGRGKTIIYQDGVFSGECVLEPTKPGENRVLPHCLENSVKINKNTKPILRERASIKISQGIVLDESSISCSTSYTIENNKDEQFKLLLEHNHVLGSDVKITYHILGENTEEPKYKDTEKLDNSTRLYLTLEKKKTIRVEVYEEYSDITTITLMSKSLWFVKNIESDSLLAKLSSNEDVKSCVGIEEEINASKTQIEEWEEEIKYLNDQTIRVRENLKAAKDVANQSDVTAWIADLGDAEKRIRTLNKVDIPNYRIRIKNFRSLLDREYKKINVSLMKK